MISRKNLFLLLIMIIFITIPLSISAASIKYQIQLGVFKKEANANRYLQTLKEKGLSVQLVKKQNFFYLFTGDYSTKRKAEAEVLKLKKRGIEAIVKTKKVVSKPEVSAIVSKGSEINIKKIPAVNIVHFNEDTYIEGVLGSHMQFFYIDSHWNLTNNCYLNLNFSHSQLTTADATLTVLLNNSPIYSIRLNKEPSNKSVIKIPLPVNKLITGYNSIELKVYNRISDDPCTDDINYASWISFNKDSYIKLEYLNKKDSNNLSDFPYPYLDYNTILQNTRIIIPTEANVNQVESLMLLAAGLGQRYQNNMLDLKVYRYKPGLNFHKDNIIYLGSGKDLPAEYLKYLSKQEFETLKNNAILKEVTSPYNKDKKLLLILSDNSNALNMAVKALARDELVRQMATNTQVISTDLTLNNDSIGTSNKKTLKELGYADVLLQGLFTKEASFYIKIPTNKMLSKDAQINLKVRYSKVLDYERSLLTVYINNIPIGSTALIPENADDYLYSIRIPKEFFNNEYLSLKVVFNLHLKGFECGGRTENSAWAFISSDSYLYIPTRNKARLTLADYPAPFIDNGYFNNVLFVIPGNLTDADINNLVNIISYLGQQTSYNLKGVSFITPQEYNQSIGNNNLIIYGTPATNKIIQEINNKLYLKFNHQYNSFLSNNRLTLFPNNRALASLQLLSSDNNNTLVITGTSLESLDWASQYLYNNQLVNTLSGEAMVIDENGHIIANYAAEKADEQIVINENKEVIKNLKITDKTKQFIIFAIVVLVIVILSIFFIRRRNK